MSEESLLRQKAFKGWESITKRRRTERQIVQRFRQFHDRVKLTNIFLVWAEKIRKTSMKVSIESYHKFNPLNEYS